MVGACWFVCLHASKASCLAHFKLLFSLNTQTVPQARTHTHQAVKCVHNLLTIFDQVGSAVSKRHTVLQSCTCDAPHRFGAVDLLLTDTHMKIAVSNSTKRFVVVCGHTALIQRAPHACLPLHFHSVPGLPYLLQRLTSTNTLAQG